jgi:hypothetical protein
MKYLIFLVVIALACTSCEKIFFDVENPDVELFVRQLKNGSYDQYEKGDNGEELWTIMPGFSREDIPALISLAEDTVQIIPCDHFPVNPMNSIPPFRVRDGETYMMIGEYLLWCAEGVIRDQDFASLTPILVNADYSPDRRLDGDEILEARSLYQLWWKDYGESKTNVGFPLDSTQYYWR